MIAAAVGVGLMACDTTPKDPYYDSHNTPTQRYIDYDHTTQTGKVIKYYESGKKRSIGFYAKGMRDSLFRSWHENGNPKLEIWYVKGQKQGLYKNYRKSGSLYREIEYKDDLKHGTYQEFWKNGNLKYSLEYQFGYELDETLQEYQSSGDRQKDSYLVITENNTVYKNNKYELRVYFDDLPKEAFYTATVDGIPYALEIEDRKGVIRIDVPKGVFIMKKVQFEGFYKGRKKTVQSVKRSFNIGVENL